MALVDNLTAGKYAMTYNSVDMGLLKEGAMLDLQNAQDILDKSDAFARSVIETFYQGANAFLQVTALRWFAGVKTPFWPWGNLGEVFTNASVPGIRGSDTASAIVMTAQTGSPAATEGPATLTASKSLLAENFNQQLLFDSRLREMPIRFRLIPYASAGKTIHFSTT